MNRLLTALSSFVQRLLGGEPEDWGSESPQNTGEFERLAKIWGDGFRQKK